MESRHAGTFSGEMLKSTRGSQDQEYLGGNTERHRLGLRGEWEFVSVDTEAKEGKLRERGAFCSYECVSV